MKGLKLCAMVLAVLMLAGCAAPTVQTPKPTQNADGVFTLADVEPAALTRDQIDQQTSGARQIAQKINEFGGALVEALSAGDQNLVLSPFSVYMTLACLSAGAERQTLEELRAALYPDGMTDEQFRQGCAELICLLTSRVEQPEGEAEKWGADPETTRVIDLAALACLNSGVQINPAFAQVAAECFGTQTATADFSSDASRTAINAWAKEATNGLIPELFTQPIDEQTVLLLANSIYFEGLWQWEFDKDDTHEDAFHAAQGETTVQYMVHDGMMPYAQTELYQAVRLYYHGGAYMDVFLPAEGVSPRQVMQTLHAQEPVFEQNEGLLELPKFAMETQTGLADALKAIGMKNMFIGGLSGMVTEAPGGDMFVSDAFQKARIEVDELGTKAAAVTVMAMAGAAMPPETERFEMRVNRPFVYRICASVSGEAQTLFVGSVNEL